MLGTALYYPHIDITDGEWLRSAILFWDEVQTIAPTSVRFPYQSSDTKTCEEEGFLRPLRCDLHQDLLEDLGKRVFRLLEDREWQRELTWGNRENNPASNSLMHADKIGHLMKSRLRSLVGIHPDKMPPALKTLLMQSGGLELLSAGKLPPNLRHILEDIDLFGMSPDKLSRELRRSMLPHSNQDDGDWILVNGRFAEVYMSLLAALLSKETKVSALTNEELSSGINLRCLVDDVAASGETAARGALVSVVMKGLRVDPQTPVRKLLSFRRGRKDQLAELSGLFDDLKGKIEKSETAQELEDGAKRLFENRIHPSLERLKGEMEAQTIQSVWDGVQRGITVSAASGGALAYITGYTGPMLLGAAAFITLADVGMKSYLARSKARSASPYTYLLDIERKFSLPKSL
jgi:hypothetical protein